MSGPNHCILAAARALRSAPASRIIQQTHCVNPSKTIPRPRLPLTGNTASSQGQRRGIQNDFLPHLQGQWRSFSQSSSRNKLKTMEQIRARHRGGPFNITAAIFFVATSGALYVYFTREKERMARKRIAEQTKGVGKPKVGGPFRLIDQNGDPFTSNDLLGSYSLVYFGFSHCPDICPDELDKMALMHDKVKEKCGDVMRPIMITCDPARDTPAVLKEYLHEFHPDFIGLTGDYEQIKNTCKAYRVYFSTPENVKPGQDYLVDHSIYFYVMDPEGDFVEAIGRNFTAGQAAQIISDHIKDWEKPLVKAKRWE